MPNWPEFQPGWHDLNPEVKKNAKKDYRKVVRIHGADEALNLLKEFGALWLYSFVREATAEPALMAETKQTLQHVMNLDHLGDEEEDQQETPDGDDKNVEQNWVAASHLEDADTSTQACEEFPDDVPILDDLEALLYEGTETSHGENRVLCSPDDLQAGPAVEKDVSILENRDDTSTPDDLEDSPNHNKEIREVGVAGLGCGFGPGGCHEQEGSRGGALARYRALCGPREWETPSSRPRREPGSPRTGRSPGRPHQRQEGEEAGEPGRHRSPGRSGKSSEVANPAPQTPTRPGAAPLSTTPAKSHRALRREKAKMNRMNDHTCAFQF